MTVALMARIKAINKRKVFIFLGDLQLNILNLEIKLSHLQDCFLIKFKHLITTLKLLSYKNSLKYIIIHIIYTDFISCMQFENTKVSVQTASAIAKIDQLLRLYQMSKKTDSSKKSIVEKKVYDLLSSIKNQTFFATLEPILKRKIQVALDDPKAPPKVERVHSNSSTIKSSSNPSQQKSRVVDASISGNINSSEENSKVKTQSKPSISKIQSSDQSSSQNKFQTLSQQSIQISAEMSNQKSEDNSYALLLDNLHSICHEFQGKAEQMLAFNEDVFTTIKQTEDKNLVYLFGVNNPEKKNVKRLYICTLMKFSLYQVFNSMDNNGQCKFQKECKMFENNLRSPMGLIMVGKSMNDIGIEHVRFLTDMNSPLGVIILLQSFKQRNGVLYELNGQTLKKSRQLNKVQYEQKSMQLRKEYGSQQKKLTKVQVVKDKLVITKHLTRAITSSIESAQNAIQIQSSNECIKQELNRFPYKLHAKYYVSAKSDYQLFFLDKSLVAFKMNFKEKEFQSFKKFVLEQALQKGNYIMSTSVLKETSQVKKEFWKLLLQSKTRDQYFLVNLSGITNKKTIILTFKQNISEHQIINADPFLFKDLEKSTDITNVIAVITKQNYKQFETESKTEVMDISLKKK